MRPTARPESAPSAAAAPAGRRVVLLVGVLMLAAVWAGVGGLSWAAREALLHQVGERSALFARVFAREATRDVDATAAAVEAVADLLARGAPPDGPELRGQLAQMQLNLPWLRTVGIVDARQRVLASTSAPEVGRQASLEALGGWPAAGPARLGQAIDGRGLLDAGAGMAPRGVAVLPMLKAAARPEGGALAVVALINAQSFANTQQTQLDDPAAAAALLGYDGRVVAATAQVPHAVGTVLSALPAFRHYLPAQESGAWTGAGLRPGVQVVAFRASGSQPLVAVVEVDHDAALAPWQRMLVALGAGAALATALIAGLMALVLRNQTARAAAQAGHARAQREIAQRERDFDLTLRSVQALIFRTDPQGALVFANARWQALAGVDPSEALGKPLWQLVAPSQRAQARALFESDRGRGVRRMVAQVGEPGGRLRSFELTVLPMWQGERLAGFVGSAADMSERIEAEQRLQAELAFTDHLMDSSPLPMSVVGGDGRYVRVNRAWEAFTGRSREAVIGRPVGEHLPLAERAVHEAHDQALHADGLTQRYEAGLLHADGSLRDVMISKVLLPGAGGRAPGVLSVLADVTDLRRAERATREARDAAEEASRAKSEFIANISHELRTPLQSIIGFAELGRLRGREQPRLAGMFDDIHAGGQRMLELVNNLLDVSKLESAVGSIHLERADLRGLVHELLRELDPLLRKRGQRVDLALPDVPLVAKVDPLRLQQVLRNVLANAMKFSPPGSRIRLAGDYNALGEPCLSVSDAGPGIPEGELESIFEAFAQSSRTKDGSGGTGLGLAICRTIVAAHGGRIHAENLPGGGAAFHIVLPARGAAETQPMAL